MIRMALAVVLVESAVMLVSTTALFSFPLLRLVLPIGARLYNVEVQCSGVLSLYMAHVFGVNI